MQIKFNGIPYVSGDYAVPEGWYDAKVTNYKHVIKSDGKELDILEFTVQSVNNTDVPIKKYICGIGYSTGAVAMGEYFMMTLDQNSYYMPDNGDTIGTRCEVYVEDSEYGYQITDTRPRGGK